MTLIAKLSASCPHTEHFVVFFSFVLNDLIIHIQQPKLIRDKLQFMLDIVHSDLFKFPGMQREVLFYWATCRVSYLLLTVNIRSIEIKKAIFIILLNTNLNLWNKC